MISVVRISPLKTMQFSSPIAWYMNERVHAKGRRSPVFAVKHFRPPTLSHLILINLFGEINSKSGGPSGKLHKSAFLWIQKVFVCPITGDAVSNDMYGRKTCQLLRIKVSLIKDVYAPCAKKICKDRLIC